MANGPEFNNDVHNTSEGSEDRPKFVCVTIPPPPFKVASVTSMDPEDLRGIAIEGVLTWIDYIADDLVQETMVVAKKFGFSEKMVDQLVKGSYEAYEDHENELGMVMPAIQVKGVRVEVHPIIILVSRNLIITVHDRNIRRLEYFARYGSSWMSRLPSMMPTIDKLTLLLTRLIGVNNERNFEQLREIEDRADDISEALLDPTIHIMETGRYIYDVKHGLIQYLNALWRSLDLLNKLRYGDAELITDNPKILNKLSEQASQLTKHISLTEHTSQVLISGTTVLQTLHNNQLLIINNRMLMVMTWMTIIGTAVLVPNTIATIFGFLFAVPNEHLVWSSAVIIITTAVCTLYAYYWLRSGMELVEIPERSKGALVRKG